MTNDYAIEPAYTTWATSYSTVLMAFLTDEITDLIVQLRRERTITDTRSVCLRYTDDLLDLGRSYARTDTYSPADGLEDVTNG